METILFDVFHIYIGAMYMFDLYVNKTVNHL